MLRKNKGSVLIITLIVFSIISLICLTCCSLVYSTIKNSNLKLKSLILKEKSLSGIEIVYNNMKSEINDIIDSSNNKDEFINCFRKDNFKSFILKSKDISQSELKNVELEIANKTNFGEVEKLEFVAKATSIENSHKKEIKVKIQIKNPWIEVENIYKEIDVKQSIEYEYFESEEYDLYNENIKEQEDSVDINSIKDEMKKQKLIIIYDYEEL